jgi:hypothetical protein
VFDPLDTFARRHIGPRDKEVVAMLGKLGVGSLEELTEKTVPKSVLQAQVTSLGEPLAETELLRQLREIASKNKVFRTYIGMGYYGTITPPVILRNIMENPGWYTQYTPYQAEIAQGRLESLINYQTMVSELTGLPVSNASLLDEGTAAAEAMLVSFSHANRKKRTFFVDEACHPQTIACVQTRAQGFGIKVIVGPHDKFDFQAGKSDVMGILIQVRRAFIDCFPLSKTYLLPAITVPQHLRNCSRLRGPRFARPRSWSSCRMCHGPPCPHPSEAPGRIRLRHCRRQRPALWCSLGIRWTPRGLFRVQGRAQAQDARTFDRRDQGRQRKAGLPACAADS